MENRVDFKVFGRRALFTDPLSKIGGEKFSYPVPTYQALKGILESVYWKPTIVWYIDRVRIVNPMLTEAVNTRTVKYQNEGTDLSIYTYLMNVEYQIQAHFEWNMNREDMAQDRNENKHYFSAKRMIDRGGRRDIFLGSRECQGYVEPCKFGEGTGSYDTAGSIPFGLMFHGFEYPDETGVNEISARFWNPIMINGVIDFIKPRDCTIKRWIREMKPQTIEMVDEDLRGDAQ